LIREAWDTGTLTTLTKNSPLCATGAHISIIAHITEEELVTVAAIGEGARLHRGIEHLHVARSPAAPRLGHLPSASASFQ
jgi:hypothetical protein